MTEVFKDSTSHSPFFELVDSTTGLPKTGIVYTDVTASYARTRGARTAITMATLASASAAYSSGGFILVDDTNQPGIYRVDVPNAAFATGVEEVVVTLKATGCRTVSRKFTLIDINKQTTKIPATIAAGDIATDAIDAASLKADAISEIQSGLATQMSVDDLPTNAEFSAALALSDDAVLAQVALVKANTDNIPGDPADASDIATAFSTVDASLALLGTYIDTEVSAIKVVTDKLGTTLQASGLLWQFTTDSLENGPSGSGGDTIFQINGPIVGRVGRVGEVADSAEIKAYHGGPITAGPFIAFEEDLVTPVDLSSFSTALMFVVFEVVTSSAGVKSERVIGRLITPDVTVGGADSNEISLANTTPLTAEIGRWRWAIRRTTTNIKEVFMQGWIVVDPCANTA